MKLFQNPIVVIILAGLAIGLVLKNAVLPMIKRGGGARSGPPPAAAPAKASTTSAKPVAKPAPPAVSAQESLPAKPGESKVLPTADIVVPEVSGAAAQWAASPRRDPFQFLRRGQDGPSARDVLKLSGTWRQTNSTLAVLNNRVVHEGDNILGFTVESVESDRVWVRGGNGRESIEFKYPISDVVATSPAVPEATHSAGSEQK